VPSGRSLARSSSIGSMKEAFTCSRLIGLAAWEFWTAIHYTDTPVIGRVPPRIRRREEVILLKCGCRRRTKGEQWRGLLYALNSRNRCAAASAGVACSDGAAHFQAIDSPALRGCHAPTGVLCARRYRKRLRSAQRKTRRSLPAPPFMVALWRRCREGAEGGRSHRAGRRVRSYCTGSRVRSCSGGAANLARVLVPSPPRSGENADCFAGRWRATLHGVMLDVSNRVPSLRLRNQKRIVSRPLY